MSHANKTHDREWNLSILSDPTNVNTRIAISGKYDFNVVSVSICPIFMGASLFEKKYRAKVFIRTYVPPYWVVGWATWIMKGVTNVDSNGLNKSRFVYWNLRGGSWFIGDRLRKVRLAQTIRCNYTRVCVCV